MHLLTAMAYRKFPEYRPKHQSGYYALRRALQRIGENESDWLDSLGEVGAALRAWRSELVESLGGEETISAQQRVIIELATRTHLMLESVDRFLLALPSLVNKSRRQLFPVVRERQQLVDSLARLMAQLGLDRRQKRVPSLADYLESKRAEDAERGDGPSGYARARYRRNRACSAGDF